MQQVTDVAHAQTGAFADFFVGKALLEFEADKLPVARVQHIQAEAGLADGFHPLQAFIRQRLGVAKLGGISFSGQQRDDLSASAQMIQGQVVDGAVKPRLGLAHGFLRGRERHRVRGR